MATVGEITLVEAGGRRLFSVRYAEPVSHIGDALYDGERLSLAVAYTPGAAVERPFCLRRAASIDGEDAFECLAAITAANVVALRAAEFRWGAEAAAAAAGLNVPETGVPFVRHAIRVAHADQTRYRNHFFRSLEELGERPQAGNEPGSRDKAGWREFIVRLVSRLTKHSG